MTEIKNNLRFLGRELSYELSASERTVIKHVCEKIGSLESVEEMIDFLFESTQDIFPCDRIGLAFVEEGGERVVAHYVRASYSPLKLDRGYQEDIEKSSLVKVMERGEIRIIDDLVRYLEENPDSSSTRLLVEEGVRSSMTCPLIVEGRVAGLLFRSSRKPAMYGVREAKFHDEMAGYLAQIFEKALQIERLEQSNRAYTEMLGFVSHEIKSPLAGMIMDLTLLLKGHFGNLMPEQRERLERMLARANYLMALVRDYLSLAMVEKGLELKKEKIINFKERVLDLSLELVQPLIEEMKMSLVIKGLENASNVELDPELFIILLSNILSNAAKYGRENGVIEVKIERWPDSLHISVYNEGPGFPDSEKPKLFRKFSRLKTPELSRRKGTGVGLYISWKIVKMHGGRIRAESKEGEWAKFIIEIPV